MTDTIQAIAAVVVLYHPDGTVADNLRSTACQVARLIVVDNTESGGETSAEPPLPAGAEYVAFGTNRGIAAALNEGMRRAAAAGYERVLTLDQDSTPTPGMVAALHECARSPMCAPAGVVAALTVAPGSVDGAASSPGCRRVSVAMTSGSLTSVEAWDAVGGFDEALFIDSVDHDFCLKLDETGYGVYECPAAVLEHRVGETAEARFVARAYPSHHSATRRYYITRNRLIVGHRHRERHPEHLRAERRATRHELVKVVLFEREKTAKLRMAWRGWRDYRRGVTGPLPPDA